MTDKLTPAMLRDLAEICDKHGFGTAVAAAYRDEAARREAGETEVVRVGDDWLEIPQRAPSPAAQMAALKSQPDAPPPPAGDLVGRSPDTAEKVRIIGRHLKLVGSEKLAAAAEECAAAIEALRADLREMTALRDKWADATLAAEAQAT